MGSYDPSRTTVGALPGELARLEAQAELTFAEELRQLGELGLDGPVLVEVGSGSGALIRRLAAAMPGVRMVALDADALLVAQVPHGVDRVCGDARSLPIRPGSVNSIVFRYVLQHLPDPVAVLREALRALAPGGSVYVIEVDSGLWGLAEPADPRLAEAHMRFAAAQRAEGGDRLIGRRLSRLLREAGFPDVRVRPFAVTSDDRPVADFAPHLGPDRLVPLVADGRLAMADLIQVAKGWATFAADPAAWVMIVGLIAAGRAPRLSPA